MLEPSKDIDTEEKQISAAIIECAIPLCPSIRRRTQHWISDECLDLVEKRKKAKHADFEEYRRLNKEVRKKLKEEREAYWNQVAAEMEEAANIGRYTKPFDGWVERPNPRMTTSRRRTILL
ncbi:unnamed protein product [Didymodactylos carnosus]|uniref:Uncharacterized protein n=1 Tax=Didymodactylos carnosus TaxID=1234261 RepID=A0A814BTN5_9BILA|nr:unnamed protein product [Didymodactylos carnosus]CAF3711440.1 unnamed protein product [Didymodactylos carnosus]